MESDERARRAALAKKIRTGVVAAGAAGALGLTGVVAAQASAATTSDDESVDWKFAGTNDNPYIDEDWQSNGGSWQVRPQDQSGGTSQPHAQTGGS